MRTKVIIHFTAWYSHL